MINQEFSPPQAQTSEQETLQNLNEQVLEAIAGGASASLLPGILRRSLSESDLSRLAAQHPSGINHIPASPTGSSSSSSLSGDELVHAGWSPKSTLDRAKGHL